MGTDKTHVDDAGVVMDFDDEPVAVAFDVENNAIIPKYIRRGISLFDVVETLPASDLNLMKPSTQGFLGCAMLLPENTKFLAGDSAHSSDLK